jgi:hypothetical protein
MMQPAEIDSPVSLAQLGWDNRKSLTLNQVVLKKPRTGYFRQVRTSGTACTMHPQRRQ